MVFFAWGEIYSLFPSTCADTYGWRYAAGNAGLLYTAKGTAVLLVPLATKLAVSASWQTVFLVAAAMNAAAAVLAVGVLKPMRRRMMERMEGKVPLPMAKAVSVPDSAGKEAPAPDPLATDKPAAEKPARPPL
jgi:OFA family oxalate/formate antiporter-like MFS transporter